jgi:hypothetical protein
MSTSQRGQGSDGESDSDHADRGVRPIDRPLPETADEPTPTAETASDADIADPEVQHE